VSAGWIAVIVVGALAAAGLLLALGLGRASKHADEVTDRYFTESSGPGDGAP
jgi:hypothetical protein